jgi:hypothetical protein
MSAFTTDTLDDAVLAGYSFHSVIDALNAGDDAEAGRQLRKVLELRAADDDGISTAPPSALAGMADDAFLRALGGRLAVVPVR